MERNFADFRWHHVAAVWTAANNGTVTIYRDGLLASRVQTGKTAPLAGGGTWVLGAEQDCFGGCFDPAQTFHGAMDDVRLWRVERSQAQVLGSMYDTRAIRSGKDVHGLVGYWPCDEDPGSTRTLQDAGMLGNHLQLIRAATFADLVAEAPRDDSGAAPSLLPAHGDTEEAALHGGLAFDNTAAVARNVAGFPGGDFTIDLWARMPLVPLTADAYQPQYALFSYGAERAGGADTEFLDNAILIQVLNQGGYVDSTAGFPRVRRLRGNLDVWVNSGSRAGAVRESATGVAHGRVVFDTPPLADGEWHHVAVSWRQEDGFVRAYVDGLEAQTVAQSKQTVNAGTQRSAKGALVLGQDQDCPGGCFSTTQARRGTRAEVRVWNEGRSTERTKADLAWPWTMAPPTMMPASLVARWTFDAADRGAGCAAGGESSCIVRAAQPFAGAATDLTVTSSAPTRTLSDAPHQPLSLMVPSFKRGDPALGAFAAGHAVSFSDAQALVVGSFRSFPSDAFTIEFWMRSTDKCRTGTPFSYATGGGEYGVSDNAVTITNYNNWAIAVNEDQGLTEFAHGHIDDHSGLGSTTGDWQHVAVTWRGDTGETHMYFDGRLVWSTTRAKGTRVRGGGTLVLGREQDCQGGCFGNAPVSDELGGQGKGAQDFRGAMDELRVWRVVRSADDIKANMDSFASKQLASHADMVSYYTFDEGEGHIAKDVSGHGNDLILTRADPQRRVAYSFAACMPRIALTRARIDAAGSYRPCLRSRTSVPRGASRATTTLRRQRAAPPAARKRRRSASDAQVTRC